MIEIKINPVPKPIDIKAVYLYKGGLSLRKVGEICSMTKYEVEKSLSRCGIEPRKKPDRNKIFKTAKAMYDSGMSQSQISVKLGVPRSTISNVFIKNKIKPRGAITHNMSNSSAYKSWRSMKVRCDNTRSPDFDRYGSSGIKYQKDWSKFENFHADMGDRPPGTTLDRIDNNLGYSKENCRWATGTQQNNNKNNNKLLEHDGICMSMANWSRKTGIKYKTLKSRIYFGWTTEEALETPTGVRRDKNTN